MKNRVLAFLSVIILAIIASCTKVPDVQLSLNGDFLSDKDKIDVKGTLMNGDMRSPNIAAYYIGKTLYVYFYDYMGNCTVTITNSHNTVIFSEEIPTYLNAEVRYYMGNLPHDRYHLTISDGTDSAEGWIYNFRIVAHRKQ